jgi:hypothetical protein
MIYLKYKYIKNIYNFNIRLNYDFKTLKNQTSVTLAMVHVIVIAPIEKVTTLQSKGVKNSKK